MLLSSLFIITGILTILYHFYNQKKNLTPDCIDCNVILISIDTLGSKHLPCYGYERNTAPFLCDFASRNIQFTESYANGTWTLPGHASLFTGLLPSEHGQHTRFVGSLASDAPFMPTILKQSGYSTYFQIPTGDETLPIDRVYNRDIDYYINYNQDWKTTLENVAQKNRNSKFFLFLHTYAVHDPYSIKTDQPIFAQKTISEIPNKASQIFTITPGFKEYLVYQFDKDVKAGVFNDKTHRAKLILNEVKRNYDDDLYLIKLLNDPPTSFFIWGYFDTYNYWRHIDIHNPDHVQYLEALYDQTILELDQQLKLFFAKFNQLDISKKTIVVITADHGEEFMEHNFIGHSTIYEPNIRVPLIMSIPGYSSQQITTRVQGIDVLPTLIDLLGIEYTYKFRGRSLQTILGSDRPQSRPVIVEGYEQDSKAIIYENWKTHLKLNPQKEYIPLELYDLSQDPEERENIIFLHPEKVDELMRFQ